MRIFIAAVAIALALAPAAYAQQGRAGPPAGLSSKQKAAIAEKEAERRATEQQYDAAMKNTPDSTQKIDPWAVIRPSGGKGAKP